MGTATVLADARSARISAEEPAQFADHVAELLRDRELRASLAAHGPTDARVWSAPVLMQQVQALYASLRGAAHDAATKPRAPETAR
jgi:hypothetical protein